MPDDETDGRHEALIAGKGTPAPGAGRSQAGAGRGVIKLHGRLVPMNVRYETPAGAGFELSSGDVTVVASPYERSSGGDAREASARLRIGDDLEVGYGGFYECTRSR